ncbi:galactose-1-phosphate uridylyltransferase [Lachnospiraceae bacterium M18-1]|nr:galactose-1-phosphate uridylyltransferase [Lachnospiraceae bacterium M18-1]
MKSREQIKRDSRMENGMMKLYENIKKLVQYGINTGLTPECERIYTTNLLLDLFQENDYEDIACDLSKIVLEDVLKELLDEACNRGIVEDSVVYRDLFDTKLMNCLMPRPAQVQKSFWEDYAVSPEHATEKYYKFSQDSDYIRRYRIKKDRKWTVDTDYGTLDITINLSKPEKDPKAIAAARNAKNSAYPKCQLCMENEGYAGRTNHPARENHRIIPITINESAWGFQYSPYVYYNEHCIVFNGEHTPMKIDRAAFTKLFDFVKQFPHYFLGSNADLPIVGGSILSHDHFQGGHYTFAMAKAPVVENFTVKGYEDVTAGIVKWPLSVIRLQCANENRIIDLAEHILKAWRGYTDEAVFIFAETEGQPHNTITPIARKRGELYELDLTLRNNITTEEHPLGVYHPHGKLHHIKKENIGLIEVMGLAVLPARLKGELELLMEYILEGKEIRSEESIEKHADWVEEFLPQYPEINAENVEEILQKEVGKVFCQVLEDAGVYKYTPEGLEAFRRFIGVL